SNLGKKVKTAIFGKDQRVKLKDYELSASGNKINITKGGEGYFMPEIGPTTFLDWPIRKRFLLFGSPVYKRIFFALKKGSRCVDFAKRIADYDAETKLGVVVYGPDEEQLKTSNLNLLATKIGQDTEQGVPWYIWIILIPSLLSFLMLLQMSGV
ncbi:unnamed protein product, partial [marine sediment metagenome]